MILLDFLFWFDLVVVVATLVIVGAVIAGAQADRNTVFPEDHPWIQAPMYRMEDIPSEYSDSRRRKRLRNTYVQKQELRAWFYRTRQAWRNVFTATMAVLRGLRDGFWGG